VLRRSTVSNDNRVLRHRNRRDDSASVSLPHAVVVFASQRGRLPRYYATAVDSGALETSLTQGGHHSRTAGRPRCETNISSS
jgi:hypothetical protein